MERPDDDRDGCDLDFADRAAVTSGEVFYRM